MKFKRGHIADVQLISCDNGTQVVRKKVRYKAYLQNHLYVMKKLKDTGLVPELRKYSIRELYVDYEYIEGRHIEEVPSEYHEECYFSCGVTLALFHRNVMDGYGPVYRIREKNVEWWSLQDKRFHQMVDYCRTQKLIDELLLKKLVKMYFQLRDGVDQEYSSCLTHRDYVFDNLIFVRENGQWRCKVLDFDHVMACPAHCDFGRVEQDIFDKWPKSKRSFLQGYNSVRQIFQLEKVLPLYRIIVPLERLVWGTKNNAQGLVKCSHRQLSQILGNSIGLGDI